MESLSDAIGEKFSGSVAEKNAQAARSAYERVADALEEPARA
jgi:Pyruvate/2-oxoacid:ferredoxin oxidoreductase gamma subunit